MVIKTLIQDREIFQLDIRQVTDLTTASYSCIVGYQAGYNITTGNENTIFGSQSRL